MATPTDKATPKPALRVKITPEKAKALAQLGPDDIARMLADIRRNNPALYSLLIAVQDDDNARP